MPLLKLLSHMPRLIIVIILGLLDDLVDVKADKLLNHVRRKKRQMEPGVYEVPRNFILFLNLIFQDLDILLQSFRPLPYLIFFPTTLILPSPVHNLIYLSCRHNNPPPGLPPPSKVLPGVGIRNFIHPDDLESAVEAESGSIFSDADFEMVSKLHFVHSKKAVVVEDD